MNHRFVITGASGFLGSHLVANLENADYKNVVLVNRSFSKNKNNYKNVVGNFSDEVLMSNTIEKNDIIVHLACSSIPATSESDKERDFQENVIGTKKLLEVCGRKKIKKFVFISSGGTVYGNYGNKPVTEEIECRPINAHGKMKLAIEKYVCSCAEKYNFDYVIMRPGNLYGRVGDLGRKQGAIDVFMQKILNGQSIEIWGDGEIVRDYVYIDDAVDLLIKVMEDSVQGVFNMGTGEDVSLKQIINLINKVSGKQSQVVYGEKREIDVPFIVLNSDKALRELGWKPKVNLEEGINRLYKKIICE